MLANSTIARIRAGQERDRARPKKRDKMDRLKHILPRMHKIESTCRMGKADCRLYIAVIRERLRSRKPVTKNQLCRFVLSVAHVSGRDTVPAFQNLAELGKYPSWRQCIGVLRSLYSTRDRKKRVKRGSKFENNLRAWLARKSVPTVQEIVDSRTNKYSSIAQNLVESIKPCTLAKATLRKSKPKFKPDDRSDNAIRWRAGVNHAKSVKRTLRIVETDKGIGLVLMGTTVQPADVGPFLRGLWLSANKAYDGSARLKSTLVTSATSLESLIIELAKRCRENPIDANVSTLVAILEIRESILELKQTMDLECLPIVKKQTIVRKMLATRLRNKLLRQRKPVDLSKSKFRSNPRY